MSPFLSENTAPDYWPGKNLLGAMLTELTCELTDDPMNEGEREDSEEEDRNKDNSEEDEDEDEYEEYEDSQQQSIDAQSQNSCPPAPTSAQSTLTIAGITDRCLFWFSVWGGGGGGGLLRAQRRPRQCCHFTGHFYVAFSKEIWCMPLQMPHYSCDKQVWK